MVGELFCGVIANYQFSSTITGNQIAMSDLSDPTFILLAAEGTNIGVENTELHDPLMLAALAEARLQTCKTI